MKYKNQAIFSTDAPYADVPVGESSSYEITNSEWWDKEAEEWWESLGPDEAKLTGHEMHSFLKNMLDKQRERDFEEVIEMVKGLYNIRDEQPHLTKGWKYACTDILARLQSLRKI